MDLEKAAISRQLMTLRCILVDYQFIYLLVQASYSAFQALGIGSTVPGLGRTDIQQFSFGLPPLSEQKRTVLKVKHLMRLCDGLEERQKQQRELAIRLTSTAIHEILAANH